MKAIRLKVVSLSIPTSLMVFIVVSFELYVKKSDYILSDFYTALIAMIPVPFICWGITKLIYYKVEDEFLISKFMWFESKVNPIKLSEIDVFRTSSKVTFNFPQKPKSLSCYFYDFEDFFYTKDSRG